MRLKKWLPKFGSPRGGSYIDDIEIKVMMKKFDIKFLVGGVLSMLVGIFTVTGHVQNVIHFADPINEMFFAALCFMGGIMGLAASKK